MITVTLKEKASENPVGGYSFFPSSEHISGHRHLTASEIIILKENGNTSSSPDWSNLYVTDEFDPSLIQNSCFYGTVVINRLIPSTLKYHDLELETGIYHSMISCCTFGDDVVVRNVTYLCNYAVGNRVMLFNIQEMSCTNHSKFGSGILKDGEPEENRVWIGVANENDGRRILPFENMLPADAYIWSHYRDDQKLLDRFVELTECNNSGKLDTHGIVEDDVIIKNTSLIKDVKIGSAAYIKGAFKLKNITVRSSEEEPSQIGEGVELVNGIMGYGSKVFYQAIAVRFVIGRNCQIKYGARVLNTVLGDNSTVSCCELLNNLVFPFHEQHHNSSFLIASTIMGQSNIASGATIGSNHNSRSPDGEIIAGRGFWPGLCSDFKHNSKFASFTLVSKGSYQCELNITYPFSLVSIDSTEQAIHIKPAYWFQYNMFAIARNNSKFQKRDRRVIKEQHIETDPLAPDTVQEILRALDRIIKLTAHELEDNNRWFNRQETDRYQNAKDYLHQNPETDLILKDHECMKRYGAKILKPAQGYREYRKVTKYFAVKALAAWADRHGAASLCAGHFKEIEKLPLYTAWVNIGGQVIPEEKLDELFAGIKAGKINSWNEVHAFYDMCDASYEDWKTRYALWVLEQLYTRPYTEFTPSVFKDIRADVTAVSDYMYENSILSRQKDYSDYFRSITYRNEEEMLAVVGKLEDNSFLKELKKTTADFGSRLEVLFREIED